MKRSPCSPNSFSSSTSSASSSSSSSCVVDHPNPIDQPPTTNKKPCRRRQKAINPANSNAIDNNSARKCKNNAKSNIPPTAAGHINRRSSVYRGVTRHRWTGRFEAHLWDKSSWNTIQNKKGKQVYLGAYDSEEDAARTYDLAALKYWGPQTVLNFPIENYSKKLEAMQNVSKEEYLASLRRCSSGFSRGVSKYRGVARHHHNGRWEARIGRVFGNKYLYLGTFSSQEEAAMAYDLAAIEYRGANAVTNFDMSNYTKSSVSSSCDLQQISQEANDSCCCFMGSKPLQPDHDDNDDDEEEQQEQQQLIQLQKQDLPAAAMPMPMPISYDHGKYYQEEPAWCSSSSSSFCLDAAAAIFDFDPLQLVDFPEIPALKHQADHDVERPLDNLFDAGGRFENNNIAHLLFEIEGSDPQEPTLPNVDVDQYLNFVEEII